MHFSIFAAFALLSATSVFAQGKSGRQSQLETRTAAAPSQFELRVVEFRLPKIETKDMTTAEIRGAFQQAADGHVEVLHTLKLRVRSGSAFQTKSEIETVTFVRKGERAEAMEHSTHRESVGPSLIGSLRFEGDEIVIDLSYDSSYLLGQSQGGVAETTPLRIGKSNVTTSLVVKSDEVVVVSGGTGAFATYIAIDLRKLP